MNKTILILAYSLITISAFGQIEHDHQVGSLIIALDKRAPNIIRSWRSPTLNDKLTKLLDASSIEPDYISGVLYGIKGNSPTPKDFATLVVSPVQKSKSYTSILNALIQEMPTRGDAYYSITSFAKPFSIISLKGQQETNRTFMAIITDGQYNGNDDYYGEASFVKNKFTDHGKDMFKETIKKVQTNYFCEFLCQEPISGGYIQLYEFIPLQQYFSLESVLDYPQTVVAKRNKSGYTIDLSLLAIENNDYQIKRLEVCLIENDAIVNTYNVETSQNLMLYIENQNTNNNPSLELRAWVRLCDNVYDNTVLHPFGSELQGANGLIKKVKIEKEENAKILGTFPLPNWLFSITFWTSSQYTAATSWGWILIISAIFLLLFIVAKNNIYKVDPKKIKI